MSEHCIMCDAEVPEGRQVCWACENRVKLKCERCKYEDTHVCLTCKYWRVITYDSKRVQK